MLTKLRRGLLSSVRPVAIGIAALFPICAHAAPEAGIFGVSLSSVEVVNFALVIGAISAAMISAIWLIRERGKIDRENTELRTALGDAQTRVSRYRALIADKDRRIVVWEGSGTPAEVLGELPQGIGVPLEDKDFIAFGRWLEARSAARVEQAIARLRSDAEVFNLVVETSRGAVLEAQGRISGGRAFVRFVSLGTLRAEHAKLQLERDRLVSGIETFQRLLDSIDIPSWLRDQSGALVWVNHAYVEAVEAQDRNDAINRELELLGTKSREQIRAGLSSERPFFDRVSTVVHGDRTFYDVAEAWGEDGSAGLAVDATKTQAIADELARTLASHAETLDQLGTPVAIFDGDQRLQFYNQAFQTLWGLETGYLDDKPDNGAFLERLRADGKLPEPHSWKDWKDTMLSAYRSVDPEPHLWHLPHGKTLKVFATARPQGGTTWVFEDLTEKVDLEARYNTLVQVQGETIDHLAEGVCVFGPDGKLKLSNPAFRALWGIAEDSAKPGTHVKAVAAACKPSDPDGDSWRTFSAIVTSFDDERTTHEGRAELASGIILDYAAVPLPNAQTMLTFVNMSDSVKVERALKDMNEALRNADSLKNDFVQHVSYELRSPLTNIIGFTDLLKTPGIGPLNGRQSEYVDHIATSSSILLTIVNDILDLATVDAGIMQLDLAEVNVRSVLDEVAEQMADRLKESELVLEIDAEEAPETIVADHQRLKQILVKLLGNAVNYAPDRTTIGLHVTREAGDAVFSVSDSGPGIPEDVIDSVFSRFETRGNSGRRRGAGLGLSIVESFVHLHNGSVDIESRPGEGTTVTCRIPAMPQSSVAAAE